MSTAPQQSKLWQRCLDIFKANADETTYNGLFAGIVFDTLDEAENIITLRVRSNFIVEQLESNPKLKTLLYRVVWHAFGDSMKIRYRVLTDSTQGITTDVEGLAGTISEGKVNTRTMKVSETVASDLDSRLNEQYTFDTFIEGTGNKLLRSVGMSIAHDLRQDTFNPLFVYGGSGVGKTHLVNAIGVQVKRNFPEKRVLYITAHDFKVQYSTAGAQNRINDFIYFYQTIDVLIIDDIQEISANYKTQGAFFNIFNHLKMNGKKIIMTSDTAPADMPGMEERLITRFKWGLCTELERPDQELCRRILLNKIQQDGLVISNDVVDYISENIIYSIRDLEGVLSSLMAYSLAYNRDVDLSIAKRVIDNTQKRQKKEITVELIMESVCRYFNVSQEDVMSQTRKGNIVLVRQLAMFLANRFTKLTVSKIGLYIGGRTHATVLHSIKHIQAHMNESETFRQQVNEIEEDLKH
ncbi:MAG: chromosomal replication initiator protein DnaA [Bacteroidaceae bacterium]|nr:chromosomal replication initiator protein DnaA [Prevotellaceae bacterium]MDY5631342.1 chromosomal replication initiator protein DnaA [Bacteroidaceae bacterium]